MDVAKTIELFERSERIGLLLPREADFDILASAEVLSRALEKQGKHVGLLIAAPFARTALSGREGIFETIASLAPLPREFILSLDTTDRPLSQLRYEKANGRVDIIVSPKNKSIDERAVSFRDGKILCDCAVAIGVADAESSAVDSGLDAAFLSETPIINMDVSDTNTQYGEVNFINSGRPSISEIVYDFLSSIRSPALERSTATLLLAGIIARSDNFRSPSAGPDTLLASSELMRLGAAREEALALVRSSTPVSLLQLAGRAAVRSRLDTRAGVLWSFLTNEDFEKTGRARSDLPYVLGHLDREFPPHRITTLLWQNTEGVRATLSGPRESLEAVRARESGSYQSPHLLLTATYSSFKEAEERLSALFSEAL